MERGLAALSLRWLDQGGDVRDRPRADPPDALGRSRLVLLIHGYNNDAEAGHKAYESFCARQREVGRLTATQPVTDRTLVGVYWPGDAAWGIASALYYPWAIAKAKASARVLSQALDDAARLHGFKDVVIVAHSLGCRLALELLKALRGVDGVLVRRVVLMAAAVPTFMLEPDEDQGLRRAWDARVGEGAMSLFSPNDAVLAYAFPLGQTLGGDGEGFLPTALGHEHWGGGAAPRLFEQHEVVGAGHSDYWGWQDTTRAQARQAAGWIRAFLGLGAVPAREIVARPRLDFTGVEPRATVAPRQLPTRTVEAWQAA